MIARFVLGAVFAASVAAPVLATPMSVEEARKFVYGKVFAFTCFDGTRGAGRVFEDGGAIGAVQFNGSGPARNMRLPVNTLQVHGQSFCASIKGLPFEPCFNLDKSDERSFRGSVSGLGFAYCDFRHQGGQVLMTRVMSRQRSPHAPEQLHPAEATRSTEVSRNEASRNDVTSHTEVTSRVETPHVEIGKIDPVKSEPAKIEPSKSEASKAEASKVEGASELRRSTE
jgi:hypothetical protein